MLLIVNLFDMIIITRGVGKQKWDFDNQKYLADITENDISDKNDICFFADFLLAKKPIIKNLHSIKKNNF